MTNCEVQLVWGRWGPKKWKKPIIIDVHTAQFGHSAIVIGCQKPCQICHQWSHPDCVLICCLACGSWQWLTANAEMSGDGLGLGVTRQFMLRTKIPHPHLSIMVWERSKWTSSIIVTVRIPAVTSTMYPDIDIHGTVLFCSNSHS